ncbi:hypothetical protein GCM10027062_08580 [Nocardioides hungaricus]
MTGPRVVIAAVALTLTLGLAGCSGDPEPRVAPPSPTAPSTTRASVQTPPEMPAAAKGTDAAAAEAFVRFYWEMVNYAQLTGDVEPLRPLGYKCINCENGIEFIEGIYSKGGEIRGGDGTPSKLDTTFTNVQGDLLAVVDSVLVLTPQDVDVPGKAKDKHYKGGDREIRMYLQPESGSWVVRTMGFP